MYFKIKLIIFIIICSIVYGQNYFNRAIGNRVSSISAKSSAMGGVGFMNNPTSTISILNPAYLMHNSGFKVDVNFRNIHIGENRSFPSIDFFEDYYADLTYVVNSQYYSVNNIGVTYVKGRFGFSASIGAFISTDYNYIEEVRHSDDTLEGYFQFKTSGDIACNSYGMGLALNKRLHLGLSVNQLLETTLTSHINDNQNIINMSSSPTSYENFATFSIWTILTDEIEFAIGFEESARIEYTSFLDMTINQSTGYPEYDTSTIMLPGSLYKPSYKRIGFSHTPNQVESHRLTIEYEQAFYSYSEIDSIKLHDVHTIGIGVEYKIYNFVPLRIGLTHRTSPFKSDLSKTIFSLGTGWNYTNFTIDVGCRYWNIAYPYRDIFPVSTDASNPFGTDMVKENHLDLSFSIQYKI